MKEESDYRVSGRLRWEEHLEDRTSQPPHAAELTYFNQGEVNYFSSPCFNEKTWVKGIAWVQKILYFCIKLMGGNKDPNPENTVDIPSINYAMLMYVLRFFTPTSRKVIQNLKITATLHNFVIQSDCQLRCVCITSDLFSLTLPRILNSV